MALVRTFPVFIVLMLASAGLMLVPALHAAESGAWDAARVFLYHCLSLATAAVILGLATRSRRPHDAARYLLLTLLATYVVLPVFLGAPVAALVPGVGIAGGYFEMLSSLTTTGASLFDRPGLLPDSLHLWRSLVGWSGGLLVLVSAVAILAPLNLGGFEIGQGGGRDRGAGGFGTIEAASARLRRQVGVIAPVYASLTGVLALALLLAGDAPLVAVCHAMAVLATSGISPVGGLEGTSSGWIGEVAMVPFLLLAVSQAGVGLRGGALGRLSRSDPQLQLMLISVLGATLLLFLRSFIGAAEIERQGNLVSAIQAIWGSLFTLLSFLTTTGFMSQDWRAMQIWSNLPDPGPVLLGVAVMGGGVATTAGGVKLLRLYALYRQGLREMELLVHPSGLARRGQGAQTISANGPRIAFVFLMLFLVALALLMIALASTGQNFDHSLVLAVAALTTTGPAIGVLADGLGYAELDALARGILCAGMVVGRMETLVVIALFNPAYWRS